MSSSISFGITYEDFALFRKLIIILQINLNHDNREVIVNEQFSL